MSLLRSAVPMLTADDEQFVLSARPPSPNHYRLAIGLVIVVLASYALALGPFASDQAYPVMAFTPAYATALVITELITATLLFAQFPLMRSGAILMIANGYLFATLILVPWTLTFPNLFGPGEKLGGPQSTIWLYFFWHVGFAIFVIGYGILSKRERKGVPIRVSPQTAIGASAIAVGVLVLLITVACTAGEGLLPRIMLDGTRFGPLWPLVGVPVVVLSCVAIVVLWNGRLTVLDLWLSTVMVMFAAETLTYLFTPSRFSVAWYIARTSGLVASSVVLVCLLYEITNLYVRVLKALRGLRREREARFMTGDTVAATIAHEVRQPLTGLLTSAEVGIMSLERQAPNLEKAREAFTRIAADSRRANDIIASVRALFKNDARKREPLDPNRVIREVIESIESDLSSHHILVRFEADRSVPIVEADNVQLQQVLLNLVSNAMDAMESSGDPKRLTVSSRSCDTTGVMVSVADTGRGIRREDAERIFNPLFTTKAEGMGMGLSICRSIVQAHDGELWTEPNEPQGAIFRFTLHALADCAGTATVALRT
jgi:signal transduction histidine kinase